MNLALFYDTETNGMPIWKEPSSDPRQPHIVQIAAKLIDTDTRTTHQETNIIVRPDEWVIPEDVSEIHGITTEMATDVGIAEIDALKMILALESIADVRIGHNEPFDSRMIRIAIKRFYDDQRADEWEVSQTECTMRAATPHCKLVAKNGRTKWPKLEEAYRYFMGKEMENAHNAMADVNATIDIYFAMRDL